MLYYFFKYYVPKRCIEIQGLKKSVPKRVPNRSPKSQVKISFCVQT